MKTIFNVVLVNLIVILFIILYFCLYNLETKIFKDNIKLSAFCRDTQNCKQVYVFGKPFVYGLYWSNYTKLEFKERNNDNPILLFGSSFINSGSEGNINSFAYVCSKYMKKTVIDYSFPGGGIQNMYFMSENKNFFEDAPKTNNVIYFLCERDLETLLTPISIPVSENSFKLHYSIKNNKIVMADYKSKFKNYIRSLYTVKYITNWYVTRYINNPRNAEKITDTELLYFKETRKNFEKEWNNKINFTVLLYGYIPYRDLLIKKLKQADFNAIRAEELTDKNFYNEEYLTNYKPNQKLWKLLMPNLSKALK